MAPTILTTFSGALQASLSVLLVIFYGVIASRLNLIDNDSAKKVSEVSVNLFLPFLLITRLGEDLNPSNIGTYVPILIWAIFYNVVSILIGAVAVRWLKLPPWIIPAVAFNNTTSLPLLLIQSLETTGILEDILRDGEGIRGAISRAQSYFLVCSVVNKCLIFALGPRLLYNNGPRGDNEELRQQGKPNKNHRQANDNRQQEDQPDEITLLLADSPDRLESQAFKAAHNTVCIVPQKHHLRLCRLLSSMKSILSLLTSFLNAPFFGAVIGMMIGLVPPLHKAFFADSNHGGIFTAWLTASLKRAGELFVSLQVIVVGVKLSYAIPKMKGGDGGAHTIRIPGKAVLFIFIIRYIFWAMVSILMVYALSTRTKVLGRDDAILWFSMMLMPTGPPAMSLVLMADVSGKDESLKSTIAKLLTGMYAVSPVLAFVVVGALKASQAALQGR